MSNIGLSSETNIDNRKDFIFSGRSHSLFFNFDLTMTILDSSKRTILIIDNYLFLLGKLKLVWLWRLYNSRMKSLMASVTGRYFY